MRFHERDVIRKSANVVCRGAIMLMALVSLVRAHFALMSLAMGSPNWTLEFILFVSSDYTILLDFDDFLMGKKNIIKAYEEFGSLKSFFFFFFSNNDYLRTDKAIYLRAEIEALIFRMYRRVLPHFNYNEQASTIVTVALYMSLSITAYLYYLWHFLTIINETAENIRKDGKVFMIRRLVCFDAF